MGTTLAIPEHETGIQTWQVMQEQCKMLVKTGFLPKAVDSPEKAMAIALQSREIGVPMMAGFRLISVIQGKPTIASELMLGLCFARIPGFKFKVLEEDAEHCKVFMARPGSEYTGQYTISEAKAAGLLSKENWGKYPAAMLRARTISLTARVVAPDVTLGIYTPDEMGAVVTEDEEVVQMPTGEVQDAEIVTASPPDVTCADCGLEIGGGTVKGKQLTAAQFASGSQKHFGRPLCAECAESAEVKDAQPAANEHLAEPEPAGGRYLLPNETEVLRGAIANKLSSLPITQQSAFIRHNPAAANLPAATHDQLVGLNDAFGSQDKQPT